MSPTNCSPRTQIDRLTELAYELLDAHSDTARLSEQLTDDVEWVAHLGYLRDLQRVGREVLARMTGTGWVAGSPEPSHGEPERLMSDV